MRPAEFAEHFLNI
jgi:hypothetical protein